MTVINKAAVKVKKSNGPPDMWPETHAEMARRAAQKAPKLELFSAFKLTDVSKAHTLLGIVRTSARLMCQPGVQDPAARKYIPYDEVVYPKVSRKVGRRVGGWGEPRSGTEPGMPPMAAC